MHIVQHQWDTTLYVILKILVAKKAANVCDQLKLACKQNYSRFTVCHTGTHKGMWMTRSRNVENM